VNLQSETNALKSEEKECILVYIFGIYESYSSNYIRNAERFKLLRYYVAESSIHERTLMNSCIHFKTTVSHRDVQHDRKRLDATAACKYGYFNFSDFPPKGPFPSFFPPFIMPIYS
jgi:hypothetical protein